MGKSRSFFRKIYIFVHLFLWLALFSLLAIAYTPLTGYMLKPLSIQEEVRDADLIVILGGGIDKGNYLNLVSSHRVVRGAQLYFEGRADKVLFAGGMAGKRKVPEATIMAQEARRLRIPAADVLLEKKSKNTRDQAVELKKIAEPLQFKSILLVTSFSHMKRAVMVFENMGFKVYPAYADPYEKYVDDPLGRVCLFSRLIHEYGGILYYKIRGWI